MSREAKIIHSGTRWGERGYVPSFKETDKVLLDAAKRTYDPKTHSDLKEDPMNSEWVLNYCDTRTDREKESYEEDTRPLNDSYANGRHSGYLSALRDLKNEIKLFQKMSERAKQKEDNKIGYPACMGSIESDRVQCQKCEVWEICFMASKTLDKKKDD